MNELSIQSQVTEAEQAVIGGLLQDNHILDGISFSLKPDDFSQENHRIIYEHILKLIALEQTADIVTVGEALERSATLEAVGGVAYLGLLVQACIPENIRCSAEVIYDNAIRRNLIQSCSDLAAKAYKAQTMDIATLLESSQQILPLAESVERMAGDVANIKSILPEVADILHKLYSQDGETIVTGTRTGFADLDVETAGLHEGELVIVAGAPSIGKTAFAINIAEHVALDSKLPVIIFSLEVPVAQVVTRMIGSVGKLDQKKLRTGDFDDEDWEKLCMAMNKLNEAPIYIDNTIGLTTMALREKARKTYQACGNQLGLIVIDTIQLMSSPLNVATGNSTEGLLKAIKALARELNVPIIALSQLNSSVKKRRNKRPCIDDIPNHDAMNNYADLIMFVYRDQFNEYDSLEQGVAEIIIGKQSNGPIGKVRLAFQEQYLKFEDLSVQAKA